MKLGAYSEREEESTEEGTHETFNRLFRRELDQRCSTKHLSTDIRHDVVANNQRGRDKEPNHSLEDTVDDKVARDDNEEKTNVDPAEKGELLSQVLSLQVGDEPDKAWELAMRQKSSARSTYRQCRA
jgi:hypothetical protein